jgi:phage gp29-like protein
MAWWDRFRVLFQREKVQPGQTLRVAPQQRAGWGNTTDDRLLNDGTLYMISNLVEQVCLGAGWRFTGADAEREDVRAVCDAISEAEGFHDMIRHCLRAMFARYAVSEIVWQSTNGLWLPLRFRTIPRRSVALDISDDGEVSRIEVSTTAGLQELPLLHAVVYRFNPTLANPLGSSLLDGLREDIEYKRKLDDVVVRSAERFGAPTVALRYPPGTDQSQVDELLRQGTRLQSASVAVLPDGVAVDFLEPRGQMSVLSLDTLRYFERRIARAILGSVLGMFEAEFGTRAQASTHWEVTRYVIRSYQSGIEQAITEQVVRRTLQLNGLPSEVQFFLNEPEIVDKEAMARWIADLAQAGIIDVDEDRDRIRQLFGLEG